MSFIIAILLTNAAIACPSGYARIPPDPVYKTERHCIAMYEMKNINNKPVSSPEGTVWNLAHYGAKEKCEELGHALPSNDLWQSMARNAEKIPENWTGGEVGKGRMKTTVKIRNSIGEVTLYNVGDSVWEHVDGRIKKPLKKETTTIEELSPDLKEKKIKIEGYGKRRISEHFSPEGTYDSAGLGIAVFRSKYIMRGGDDQDPGIFGFATNHGPDPEHDADDVGFRCACRWEDCRSPDDPPPKTNGQ